MPSSRRPQQSVSKGARKGGSASSRTKRTVVSKNTPLRTKILKAPAKPKLQKKKTMRVSPVQGRKSVRTKNLRTQGKPISSSKRGSSSRRNPNNLRKVSTGVTMKRFSPKSTTKSSTKRTKTVRKPSIPRKSSGKKKLRTSRGPGNKLVQQRILKPSVHSMMTRSAAAAKGLGSIDL
ncbi:hypothetical protein ACOME3_009791 [Neoechinorhynchus agilis]